MNPPLFYLDLHTPPPPLPTYLPFLSIPPHRRASLPRPSSRAVTLPRLPPLLTNIITGIIDRQNITPNV